MRVSLLLLLVSTAILANGQTYTTHFPLTENPISEGGHWVNGETVCSTTPGLAIGHEDGIHDYTDALALLTGDWGTDQSVMANVYSINQNDACYEEVEIHLRGKLLSSGFQGYEVAWKCTKTSNAYLIIVRVDSSNSFTILANLSGAQYGVDNGDSVRAQMIGKTITVYTNGVQKAQVTDVNAYGSGNPGMGFNLHGCVGTNSDYGFTSFTATASSAPPPIPVLVSPANGATGVEVNPTLSWNTSFGAMSYRVQISTSASFVKVLADSGSITSTVFVSKALAGNSTYYWHVDATNGAGTSAYSTTFAFTTGSSTAIVNSGPPLPPSRYLLDQNYPNPFNPHTTIRYDLPQKSYVTLAVYNTLGELVARLVNRTEDAGYYEVKFNSTGLPSGVYLYRLHAGSFVQTKKLLLLR